MREVWTFLLLELEQVDEDQTVKQEQQ